MSTATNKSLEPARGGNNRSDSSAFSLSRYALSSGGAYNSNAATPFRELPERLTPHYIQCCTHMHFASTHAAINNTRRSIYAVDETEYIIRLVHLDTWMTSISQVARANRRVCRCCCALAWAFVIRETLCSRIDLRLWRARVCMPCRTKY